MALRRPVLRARPGGEPDQAPQGPVGLGPDQLPLAFGEPDAPDLAHRGLLADADPPRCHPGAAGLGPWRVLHHPAAPAENRGAGQGDGEPGAAGVCRQLSGGGPVPRAGRRADPAPDVSRGACAPVQPVPINPLRLPDTA